MPAKKHQISDADRAKRIREAAKELATSNDPKDFERAFGKIATVPERQPKSEGQKK